MPKRMRSTAPRAASARQATRRGLAQVRHDRRINRQIASVLHEIARCEILFVTNGRLQGNGSWRS